MRPFLSIFILILLSFQFLYANKKITIGFLPYLSADEILKKYTPLAQYLEKHTGLQVEILISKDYNTHIQQTGDDRYDISFLGGIPYVTVSSKYGLKPLLARYEFNNNPTFGSIIFARKDSPINTIQDLRNKSIAFGSKQSTLSTIVPQFMLFSNGIDLKDLQSFTHLTNHENVLYGVMFGDFDAGAVAQEVYNEMKNKEFKIIQKSKQISTHIFVASNTLHKSLVSDIKKALLSLSSEPRNQNILDAISPKLTGFVDVKDSDYDPHRKIIQTVQDTKEKK